MPKLVSVYTAFKNKPKVRRKHQQTGHDIDSAPTREYIHTLIRAGLIPTVTKNDPKTYVLYDEEENRIVTDQEMFDAFVN